MHWAKDHRGKESLVYLTAGACSELVSSVVSVPIEVVKCRMQLGRNPHAASGGRFPHETNYRHAFHASHTIITTEGWKGLFSGFQACLAVDMLFSGCSFVLYENVSRQNMIFYS